MVSRPIRIAHPARDGHRAVAAAPDVLQPATADRGQPLLLFRGLECTRVTLSVQSRVSASCAATVPPTARPEVVAVLACPIGSRADRTNRRPAPMLAPGIHRVARRMRLGPQHGFGGAALACEPMQSARRIACAIR